MGPIGKVSRNSALARARSAFVNQFLINTKVQVSTPPSERPSAKRLVASSIGECTKAVVREIELQSSSRQSSTRFGLQVEASRPAGICRIM